MQRREFIAGGSGAVLGLVGSCSIAATEISAVTEGGIDWYNVQDWGVEGRGFSETKTYFDRLPSKANGVVRNAVWGLSLHSAGMSSRFNTDSRDLHVRYRLKSGKVAMPHMPATGVSGVDLYGANEKGEDRWISVSRPSAQDVNYKWVTGIDPPGRNGRLYTAYLPLYNGIEKMEVGVRSGSRFAPIAPRKKGTIVFYGTSIMHGACASRPGMALPAILGRWYNRPVINLGFSGNGMLELELADLLGELDASVYCIDCLPNLVPALVKQRTIPFFERLRKHKPDTPILMVEDRTYTNAPFYQRSRDRHTGSREAFRAGFNTLKKSGDNNLHYLEGKDLLGSDGEGATDGSHPNDLGFMRYAEQYRGALDQIIKQLPAQRDLRSD
ncbi:MAG: hypothetical protein HOB73_08685 [Planctomycetaceae bacterium]|jgi:hypothetical protein|nr:hypothetical protein [Planctomycetaceae bacterium]